MADIVVRYRPFWSFFILSTEKWLGRMSSSGLHFYKMNLHGIFYFKTGNPQNIRYCFSYTKFEGGKLKKKSPKSGWDKIFQCDKWSVYKSAKSAANADLPNRRGLYLHNNSLLCLYAFLSSIVLLAALGIAFGLFAFSSRNEIANGEFYKTAFLIIGIFALLLIVNFIFFLSMASANSRILEEPKEAIASEKAYRQFISHNTFERWLEKLLIKDGDISKKILPLWFMSPRKFEREISDMERRGLNIYKVHKSGMMFYFTKGTPRNVKYCVVSNVSSVSNFIGKGWRVIYSSGKKFVNIAVIAKTFETEPPEVFESEKGYIVNAARITARFTLSYFILLILAITIMLALASVKAASVWIILSGIVVALCTLFIVRILLYFTNTVIIAHTGRIGQISH
jgi:hypothetical protein